MGFLKQFAATVAGGLTVALILKHLDFITLWFASKIWIIIFYIICITIGLAIGWVISLKDFKACKALWNFLKWFFKAGIRIILAIFRWFKIIFTINKLEVKIENKISEKLEPINEGIAEIHKQFNEIKKEYANNNKLQEEINNLKIKLKEKEDEIKDIEKALDEGGF